MTCNVIFPTDTFFILFFLLIIAFAMFLTFLLFQSNLYVVLTGGKGPKNSVHGDLFKTKIVPRKRHLPKISS